MKTIFILILALSILHLNVNGETFMNRLLIQTCCTSCPENNASNNSAIMSNKYKNFILNSLSSNFNSTGFLVGLRNFPPTSTKTLCDDIGEFNFRNISAYSSRGGVDPFGKSYSLVDQGTINFYFNATKSVILSNMSNRSPNYVNTYANFVQNVRSNFNSMSEQTLQSGTLDNSPASSQQINYMAMSIILNIINSLTNQEQQSILNCLEIANMIQNFGENNKNMPQLPMQQDYLNPKTDILSRSQIINSTIIYYSRNTTIPDGSCPMNAEIGNIFNNPSRRLNGNSNSAGTISLKTFNIWFERRLENEPTIYDPIYIDLLSRLNFDGTVYSPNNEDLSALPNGGFGTNEDALQIWNKIANDVFRPMLYYKITGLENALQQTCPLTCDQTC